MEGCFIFDDEFFYVFFVCFDDEMLDIVNFLWCDFDYLLNDNVGFVVGLYNDKLNGFFFVIIFVGV